MAEVLAGDEQTLHEEGGFDEIATIVIGAEVGDDFSGAAIEEVRPDSMEAVGFGEEADDLEQVFGALFACDEAAVHSDD